MEIEERDVDAILEELGIPFPIRNERRIARELVKARRELANIRSMMRKALGGKE